MRRPLTAAALACVLIAVLCGGPAGPRAAAASGGYVPVDGAGSTWSQNALDQWRRTLARRGILVNYAGTGSTDGRAEFIAGLTDFAVSEIPFQEHPVDGSTPEDPTRGYAYLPIVAGGTALMYHVTADGKRIDNLRLSPATVTKIFTGLITRWDDAQIAADNPGLRLPDEAIVPVARADSAGTTAQFTAWMAAAETALWQSYCARVGLTEPCGAVSEYPIIPGMRAQAGSLGVSDYIAQPYGEGAIGYVETSYALLAGYPVADVLNTAGYYVAPTAQAVAVALLKVKIDTDVASPGYLTEQLAGVYSDPDPRAYPLSSYSYLIVPTTTGAGFTAAKGATLAAFGDYALCEGQADVAQLGYSPLPVNLVRAGLAQIERVPGAPRQPISVADCGNPAFSPTGDNAFVRTAVFPPSCARQGAVQCGRSWPAASPGHAAGRPQAPGQSRAARQPGPDTGGTAAIAPVPLTIPPDNDWTSPVTMIVLFTVLLGVLLGPLWAVSRLRRKRDHS